MLWWVSRQKFSTATWLTQPLAHYSDDPREYVCSFSRICIFYCKNAKSLKTDYQNILGVWHFVVMMDIEISCKGHCEKLSHFQALVSHTVWVFVALQE